MFALAGLSSAVHAETRPMTRVIAMDWPGAQNLLALGIAPMALPERDRYRSLVVEPAVPSTTLDLGLRSEPNLELITQLRPDLVLMGEELDGVRDSISRVAPVEIFSPDGFDGSNPLVRGGLALQALAARLDITSDYQAYRQSFEADLDAARSRLVGYDGRPVFIATIIDGRRMLLFGRNSLFQSVFDRFGIVNAWDGFTTPYGHTTVTADRLAQQKDARLLCVGDSSTVALAKLLSSPVVASLPFIRSNRVTSIPDVLFYGGLPSAHRFAKLASIALAAEH